MFDQNRQVENVSCTHGRLPKHRPRNFQRKKTAEERDRRKTMETNCQRIAHAAHAKKTLDIKICNGIAPHGGSNIYAYMCTCTPANMYVKYLDAFTYASQILVCTFYYQTSVVMEFQFLRNFFMCGRLLQQSRLDSDVVSILF